MPGAVPPEMNPTDPRLQAALDAAINQIKTTAATVADRVSDLLGTMSLSATRISERDLMLSSQFEMRRNMASFHLTFRDALRDSVAKDIAPRDDGRRRLEATDWQSLSLVDDNEVEQRMHLGVDAGEPFEAETDDHVMADVIDHLRIEGVGPRVVFDA